MRAKEVVVRLSMQLALMITPFVMIGGVALMVPFFLTFPAIAFTVLVLVPIELLLDRGDGRLAYLIIPATCGILLFLLAWMRGISGEMMMMLNSGATMTIAGVVWGTAWMLTRVIYRTVLTRDYVAD